MADRASQLRETLRAPTVHERWERAYRTAANEAFYETVFDRLVTLIGLEPGATVLDAGSGPAAHAIRLARRGARVTAVDVSESALAMAAENVRRAGLEDRVELLRADLEQLPFGDGEFRYVVCWGVLTHIPKAERVISELARVTAPNGWAVIAVGNMYSAQSLVTMAYQRLRPRKDSGRTPSGLERWKVTDGETLFIREFDIGWLRQAFSRHGFQLKQRLPGQFTEAYVKLPSGPARLVHVLNRIWFRYVRAARPAAGNILFFQKSSEGARARLL